MDLYFSKVLEAIAKSTPQLKTVLEKRMIDERER